MGFLLLLILIGVWLRFHRLTTIGLEGSDTVYYTNLAKNFSEGDRSYRLSSKKYTYRPLVLAVYATAIKVLGYHDYSIKAINAITDTLSIALVFLITWLIRDRDPWIALAATAMAAWSPWAIHFARMELVHSLSLFFVLLATLFLVLYRQAARRRLGLLYIALSGVTIGAAALTHEELLLLAAGFLLVILLHPLVLPLSLRKRAIAALAFGLPLALVTLRLVVVSMSQVGRLAAVGSKTLDSGSYFHRLARYSWNALAENSSPWMALLGVVLLTLAFGHWIVARIVGRREPLAVGVGFLVTILGTHLVLSAFFFQHTFFRLFLPISPLAIIAVLATSWTVARRYLSPAASKTAVLLVALVGTVSSWDHFGRMTNGQIPNHKDSDYWSRPSAHFGLPSFMAGIIASEYDQNWNRQLFESMKGRVTRQARLLVTPSVHYPYPGRRIPQIGFYFGDNAIYKIDHRQPLDTLISEHQIKYVLITRRHLDGRVLGLKEYEPYRYQGRWSDPVPLELGDSYGFAPGTYTIKKEIAYLQRYLKSRGAKILTATGVFAGQEPIVDLPFKDTSYVVYEIPDTDPRWLLGSGSAPSRR